MTIEFENYGRFYPALSYNTNEVIEHVQRANTLKRTMDFIERAMVNDGSIILGTICDAETGEVVATIIPEEEDDESLYNGDWGYNEDCGFDPYLGCYTDDC